MRKLFFIPILLALLAAAPASASRSTAVQVRMADPGCHWFYSHGKNVKSLTVTGAVTVVNYDEAALKFVGPGGTKIEKRLGKLTLKAPGTYRITMVGQAPDDNHLKLVIK
jgi:hypothetical protein